MHNASVWWLVLGLGIASAAGGACGSSSGNGYSEYDAGDGEETGGGFDSGIVEAAPEDTAPVVHDDFTQPILDTGVPPNAPAAFGGADTGGAGPCVYEPELGSLFPKNWLRPRFRFTTAQGENIFEIKLVVPNEKSPLLIYTTKSGYVLDKNAWTTITTIGTGTVHMTVRSAVIDATGKLTGGPFKGAEGDIEIAPVEANGSVLYWTTSSGTVLKGFKIGDESVQPVITPAAAGTQCVACHTSTPDGIFTGLTASDNINDGSGPGYVKIVSVDGKGTEPPFLSASAKALLARTNQHAPSFSKAHWAPGDYTVLTMMPVGPKEEILWTNLEADGGTQGTSWNVLPRNGDANAASSGTFSHDGKKVVYVSTTASGAGVIQNADGEIWSVDYNNKAGGNAAAISGANDPGAHQFYPTFSADDMLVAYNRVPKGQSSYNDPAAEVYVVPAAGGTATRLAANDPPTCLNVKSPGITNSWPKWSPEVKSSGGKTYYFLVFSSTRNAATNGPQLYVAPIVVSGSTVTTYAALYLWNQPEAEHNHTPAWDVFQLPPPK
jgi:mono/diheme cytochrome c family protein